MVGKLARHLRPPVRKPHAAALHFCFVVILLERRRGERQLEVAGPPHLPELEGHGLPQAREVECAIVLEDAASVWTEVQKTRAGPESDVQLLQARHQAGDAAHRTTQHLCIRLFRRWQGYVVLVAYEQIVHDAFHGGDP